MADSFEPRIVGFLCRWCSYAGADLAGTSRMRYPPNVIPIRVNCSGRIDPTFVMKALSEGADGVLLAGCHFGDCHYIEGNYKAMRRFLLLKKALDELGLEPGRVRLEWVSAGEGERFAQVITEMVEEVRNLGPLNWTGGHKVRAPLELPEDQLPSEEETQHEASIEKREGVVV